MFIGILRVPGGSLGSPPWRPNRTGTVPSEARASPRVAFFSWAHRGSTYHDSYHPVPWHQSKTNLCWHRFCRKKKSLCNHHIDHNIDHQYDYQYHFLPENIKVSSVCFDVGASPPPNSWVIRKSTLTEQPCCSLAALFTANQTMSTVREWGSPSCGSAAENGQSNWRTMFYRREWMKHLYNLRTGRAPITSN